MALNHIEKTLICRMLAAFPPPQVFDLLESKNPEKARQVWGNLEKRGYVTISDHAVCGFERVRGEYVLITEAGIQASQEMEHVA